MPLPGRGVSPFGVNLTIFERDCKGQPPFAGVRGVPENLFLLFLRAAAGGAQEMRMLGHSPKPQVKGCRP